MTEQMQAAHMQLVVPAMIHNTYTRSQCRRLMSVGNFIALVTERQEALGVSLIPTGYLRVALSLSCRA